MTRQEIIDDFEHELNPTRMEWEEAERMTEKVFGSLVEFYPFGGLRLHLLRQIRLNRERDLDDASAN